MGTFKKKILFSVLGIVLVGAIIASYLYNKEGPDIENAPALKIAATDLYEIFSKDSIAANNMYQEKILEVSGEVSQVAQNQQNQSVILLKTSTDGASLNCTLEGASRNVKKADKISIKGICKGLGQGDEDLGIAPDVYLIRGYIIP